MPRTNATSLLGNPADPPASIISLRPVSHLSPELGIDAQARIDADLTQVARKLSTAAESAAAAAGTLAECALSLLSAEGCAIACMEEDLLRVEGAAGQLAVLRGRMLPVIDSIALRSMKDRRPLVYNGASTDGDAVFGTRLTPHVAVHDLVTVPLEAGGHPFGVVVTINSLLGAFSAPDVQHLERLADLGSLALRSAHLLEHERQNPPEARSLEEVVQHLNRSLELETAENARLHHAADRAARLAAITRTLHAISRTSLTDVYAEVHRATMALIPGARIFALLLADAQRTCFVPQLIVVDGVSTGASALPAVSCGHCGASRALATARPVMSDVPPERAWSSCVAGVPQSSPVRAEIAVPILHGEEARGVLVVQAYVDHAFDADDVDVLCLIARQAGSSIENARLFEAERSAREIAETASGITRSALGSVTAAQTAVEILEAVDRVVPSTGKALGLAVGGVDTIVYLAASGALEALRGVSVLRQDSVVPLVVGHSEPLLPSQAALSCIREGNVARPGAIVFPLIARNRVLGVLWTVPVAGARPRATDLDALGRLAPPIALAADLLLLGDEERKRRERERMLATALATMDQPVVILGLDQRVWYANAAAMREYQYDLDELTELTFDSLVASAVPARRLGPSLPTTSSSVWLAEHVHQRRDGSQFPASVMLSDIRDDAGAHVGQVLTVRNLTDERRLEEQLRQSEKLAALGELVAGVAHELNNPLAGISAFAQLLLEEEMGSEQRDSVRLIKREADRAVGVIRDLLIFSRKAGPTRAPVDVNDILELTLRLRNYSLRSAGIDVRLELDPEVPRVRGDDQRLQQVLLNLLVNAEYALRLATSKRLTVRTQCVEGGLCVLVIDTGTGMAEETRQRIFEPFFTTKPAGQGTGLGLSVSYGIVQAHGGSITVESDLGIGTTFRIFLPASGAEELVLTAAPTSSHD